VIGTITTLSASSGTLAISPGGQDSSSPVNLTTVASTVISVDGSTVPGLAALAVGMRVTAVYQVNNGVNTALRINASSKAQISGIIKSVSADGNTLSIVLSGQSAGAVISITLTGTTGVSLSGARSQASSLLPGMEIRAYCQIGSSGITATQIQAHDKLHVAGTITAVTAASGSTTAGTITLTPANDTSVNLNVDLGSGSGVVTLDGNTVTALASLLPGTHAKATYQLTGTGNNVIRMHVSDMLRVHGTISAVTIAAGSTTAGIVTITPTQGTPVNLNVNLGSKTTLRVNGSAVTTLNSLQSGMRVEARYQVTGDGNNATSLSARSGS
jgi:hypothetical protein